MLKNFEHNLYACGKKSLPESVTVADVEYQLEKIFKHDFFAATALYKAQKQTDTSDKNHAGVILKLQRQHGFLFVPMAWLGRLTCRHETAILDYLNQIPNTPNLLVRYGKYGFIYEYVEGVTLDDTPDLPQDFFDKLLELVRKVHQRDIIYLDMNKRGNIILGDDGNPHLIDFQISLHISNKPWILRPILKYIRRMGQAADIYHICKHKRKLSPKFLRPHEYVISRRKSLFIKIHRIITTPITRLRRNLLKYFYTKGMMAKEENMHYSPENDPKRFMK
ncbi:MAG: hypothetical protein FVQ80_02280 [Planctomycetes bacterium]|nr:hypothetical protein [Planctomycetota bacterium]